MKTHKHNNSIHHKIYLLFPVPCQNERLEVIKLLLVDHLFNIERERCAHFNHLFNLAGKNTTSVNSDKGLAIASNEIS